MDHHLGRAAYYVRYVFMPIASVWNYIPKEFHLNVVIFCVAVSGACLIFARWFPPDVVLPSRELKAFKTAAEVLKDTQEQKTKMYTAYLRQSVSEDDYKG